jgi:hypothetical protein
MAYVGKMEIHLNHPFAHSQVSFGLKRPGSSSSASEKPKPKPEESSSNQPPPEPSPDSTPSD